MSEVILAGGKRPFSTEQAAKRMQTEKAKEGIKTEVTDVGEGFGLTVVPPEPEVESKAALAERRESRRPERIPLHKRNVLTVSDRDKDPNYVYRIVNDKDDRIERFKEAGYEHVLKSDLKIGDPSVEDPSQLGVAVSKPVGAETTGYLMRIKREWYEDDQRAKAEKIKTVENQLQNQPEKQGQYGKVDIGR